MFTARWAGVVVATGMLAGCQPQKPASPPPPPQAAVSNYSPEDARAFLQHEDPRTLVGRVAEVMPERNLAAVRDIPANDVAVSDTLSIVASRSDLQQVALATVINVKDGIVVVRYGDGTRVPRRGDLAVRMATGPKPLNPSERGAGGASAPVETPAPPLPPSANQPKEIPAPPVPPAATETPKDAPAPPAATEVPKDAPAPPLPPSAPKEAPAATETPAPKPSDAPKAEDKNK
ncbi:MAG: hypothetical protein JWO87_995 [Phycisphaerales bacterium]|nr:hypothetical protein [Phycisphaerales bacterium]